MQRSAKMIPKESRKLEERALRNLARFPGATAQELHRQIIRSGTPVTLRGVFKVLSSLRRKKVVIKVGNAYSLRLSWVIELRAFTDQVLQNYRSKSLFYTLIPARGKSLTWRFPDPAMADDFWRQLALSLFDRTKKKNMFYWIKHAWFQLPSVEQELRFQEVLRSNNYKIYIIVEGDTYLDRSECKDWPHNPYIVSHAASPFQNATWGSLSVLGEYIVTLNFDAYIRNEIDAFFSRVRSARDLDLGAINRLLQLKGRCAVRLEHAPEKARKLKAKFARYFGVDGEAF